MALGARLGDVLRGVVVEGMKPTLLGVVIGAAGALLLGRVLSSLVFEVKPTDPVTFLAVAALLSAIALLASIIPVTVRPGRSHDGIAIRVKRGNQ